ncbi:uncharacterized protein LOC111493334 [Cucurbita maxima]|uniref:Uncharacterized protein LOC111493334 n=1 Tax=Cucurbita maxima TaxID=3661 RepID=A0A6J1KDE1_CUCMA|nr:uncharacterized protein LOC111493334 [Cucurbita maxima]
MAAISITNHHARALWFRRLASAFRTALACTVVAYTTLYGPPPLRRQVAFPAFSYLTAMLIVTNASLGDTIRGCFLALFATVQTVCPAMFLFWFIGPTKFSHLTIAITVALASIVVVLPTSTHVLAKKIALGQIVLIYVVGFIGGAETDPLMHPLHVAATTALGAAASVCATLLPFPRLASLQVKEKSKEVVENMVERLNLMVKAILTHDDSVAAGSISKARLLSSSASKLLHSIQHHQESKPWEGLPFKIFKLGWLSNSERLEELEKALKGMELALSTIPSYPIEKLQNQALKHDLNALDNQISLALKQANACSLSDSLTFPVDDTHNTLKSIQIMPTNQQDLPHLFFIFCMKLLQTKSQIQWIMPKNKTWVSSMNSQWLMQALKFAISLGIAVFLGLMYCKENGFWASLAVAVSITSEREATFKVANVKVHGTMLGSVYGILSFVIFKEFLLGRLLCLLPWFVFTSFLQHNRMYGSAGGVAALVGALVVLGRTNYGAPGEFAFVRTIETFIGISISVVVDIILQPTRASKMAKIQLNLSLQSLQKCIESLNLRSDLEENERALRIQVNELKKLIEEAEAEPNFWFLPFHSNSYSKLLKSLSKTVDFLAFSIDAMKNLKEEVVEDLEGDIERFKEMMKFLVSCYVDMSSLKCLKVVENEGEKVENCDDVEMGEGNRIERDEIEKEKLINCLLKHSVEIVDEVGEGKDDKSDVILSLSAVAFCLSSLMRGIEEIGEALRELVQWENPSSTHLDFDAIIVSRIHVVKS